MTKRKN